MISWPMLRPHQRGAELSSWMPAATILFIEALEARARGWQDLPIPGEVWSRIPFRGIEIEEPERGLFICLTAGDDVLNSTPRSCLEEDRLSDLLLAVFDRSTGRVQTVALRMIVERERERMQFHTAGYWDLEGVFATTGDDSGRFPATLVAIDETRLATGKDYGSDGRLRSNTVVELDEAAGSGGRPDDDLS